MMQRPVNGSSSAQNGRQTQVMPPGQRLAGATARAATGLKSALSSAPKGDSPDARAVSQLPLRPSAARAKEASTGVTAAGLAVAATTTLGASGLSGAGAVSANAAGARKSPATTPNHGNFSKFIYIPLLYLAKIDDTPAVVNVRAAIDDSAKPPFEIPEPRHDPTIHNVSVLAGNYR